MSITASKALIDAYKAEGKRHTQVIFDEWSYMTKPMSTNMNHYEIRRLGYKDYGVFRVGDWPAGVLAARYACSHLEARRRWAMVLVTKRLCS